MPRPFPLSISIGTDICSVHRILRIATTDAFERFAQRILTPAEWSLHQEKLINPAREYKRLFSVGKSNSGIEIAAHKAASFLAGRFAAKEAVIKSNHYRRLYYHDIEIVTIPKPFEHPGGSLPPIAIIRSKQGSWENGQEVPISISHDGDYATATSLAFSAPDPDNPHANVSPSQPYSRDPTPAGATALPERPEARETQVQGEMDNSDGGVIAAAYSKENTLGGMAETQELAGNEKKIPTTEG